MNSSASGRGAGEPLIIEKVLAGEKDLFHDLIRPYERGAYLLAYSILRNQDDAEEAVQQAMVKIFVHLAGLTERDRFKPWVLRIVENEARMCRRKRREHLYQSLDETPEASEETPFYPKQYADWRELPSEAAERKEVRAAVAKALDELPEIYREVFILRDVQQLDVAQTAEVLGIGQPAVKTRLHRARLMLRELLAPIFVKPRASFWERLKGVNPWSAARK